MLPDGNDCSVFTQIYLEEEGEWGERGGVKDLAYCCVNTILSEISKENRCVKWRKVRDKGITLVGAQDEGTVGMPPMNETDPYRNASLQASASFTVNTRMMQSRGSESCGALGQGHVRTVNTAFTRISRSTF